RGARGTLAAAPQSCHIGLLRSERRAPPPGWQPADHTRQQRKTMAGHSQFKNIMHRKGAQDKKRAKVFTKIIRELTTAARGGAADPEANPRLRAAIIAAKE